MKFIQSSTSVAYSRRRFLKRLGVAPALLPFVPLLNGHAHAASGSPKRLILVFQGNGTVDNLFWPQGSGSNFSFPAGSILEALTPFKDYLFIPNGLKRDIHKNENGDEHARAGATVWTGSTLNQGTQPFNGGWASGPSVDQVVVNALPKETRKPSLELAVIPSPDNNDMTRTCYAGNNQPLVPEDDPYRLYQTLYGGGNTTDVAAAKLRDRRKSILDAVNGDLNALKPKLDQQDRYKIEQHLDLTREIERQLAVAASPGVCAGPMIGSKMDIGADANFPALLKAQTDLMVSALACDITRVASLQCSRAQSHLVYSWLGLTKESHAISHDANDLGSVAKMGRWHAQQFAYLLSSLRDRPEGNGNMLDNSLVVWAHEMNIGHAHSVAPSPIVMAGKCGGAIRAGRYVQYSGDVWNNNLLVSICHAMGATNVNRVGNFGQDGPLADVA